MPSAWFFRYGTAIAKRDASYLGDLGTYDENDEDLDGSIDDSFDGCDIAGRRSV